MGIISPIGNDIETAWRNSVDGVSGVRAIEHFEPSDYSVRFAATVRDFDGEA
jgi:3-oxoacyl-[acyl-carrier-protein] synthase II